MPNEIQEWLKSLDDIGTPDMSKMPERSPRGRGVPPSPAGARVARGVGGLFALILVALFAVAPIRGLLTPSEQVAPSKAASGVGGLLPSDGRDALDLFDQEVPLFLVGEEAASAQDAAAATGGTAYVPTAEGASDGEFWANPDSGEVGIRYGTDLVVIETPWPSGSPVEDGMNPYERKKENLGAGITMVIGSNPGFVLPMNSRQGPDGQLQPSVNIVQVYVDGTDVTLMSPVLSVAELQEQAASLSPIEPPS